jgi:NAD-dependent dihydropyrimidine dehydrogenase PreA subunit
VIELISVQRCTDCNICVRVCPTNVFELGHSGMPVIARQEDCQTCFQCEAYCPEDAIFVAPLRTPAPVGSPFRDEASLAASGQLGLYRARVGWGKGPPPEVPADDEFFKLIASSRR